MYFCMFQFHKADRCYWKDNVQSHNALTTIMSKISPTEKTLLHRIVVFSHICIIIHKKHILKKTQYFIIKKIQPVPIQSLISVDFVEYVVKFP